jgi:hypothetical protein
MFTQADFHGETATKLQVIIMAKFGKPPLDNFNELTRGEKKRFNDLLNTYVASLPKDWQKKIDNDFNLTCNDEIYNEKFKPEECSITEVNHEIRQLAKDETV